MGNIVATCTEECRTECKDVHCGGCAWCPNERPPRCYTWCYPCPDDADVQWLIEAEKATNERPPIDLTSIITMRFREIRLWQIAVLLNRICATDLAIPASRAHEIISLDVIETTLEDVIQQLGLLKANNSAFS